MTVPPWSGVGLGEDGRVAITAFAVPPGSPEFWGGGWPGTPGVRAERPVREHVLAFEDTDGLPQELDERGGGGTEPVATEHAVSGFHGVTLVLA
jgi:hypothetical protein